MTEPKSPESNPTRIEIGRSGEESAARYLESLGWRILARNYRTRYCELDIVAEEPTPGEATHCFIEVKTRRSRAYGSPASAVGWSKQEKIRLATALYLQEFFPDQEPPPCRYDIIEVEIDLQNNRKITLIRSAF